MDEESISTCLREAEEIEAQLKRKEEEEEETEQKDNYFVYQPEVVDSSQKYS